eukprot:gene6102-10109_t
MSNCQNMWEKVAPTTEFIKTELESIEEKKKQVEKAADSLSTEVEKIIEQFKKDYLKKMEDHEFYIDNMQKSFDIQNSATNLEEIMKKAKEVENIVQEKTVQLSYHFDSKAVIDDVKFECPNLIKFSTKSEKQVPKANNETTEKIQNDFAPIFRFFDIKPTKNLYKDLFSIKDKIKSTDESFLDRFLEYMFLFYDIDRSGYLDEKEFKVALDDTLTALCPLSLKTIGQRVNVIYIEKEVKEDLWEIFSDQIETFKKDIVQQKTEGKITLNDFKLFFKEKILGELKKFTDSEGSELDQHIKKELIFLGILEKDEKLGNNNSIFDFPNLELDSDFDDDSSIDSYRRGEFLTISVDKAISKGICTSNLTKKNYTFQKAYHCHDCNLNTQGDSICESCILKCHSGHTTYFWQSTQMFCDCAYDGNCLCFTKKDETESSSSSESDSESDIFATTSVRMRSRSRSPLRRHDIPSPIPLYSSSDSSDESY